MFKFIKLFTDKFNESRKNDPDLKRTLRRKYCAFQDLLKQNNMVLMTMADMQEKLTAEYLFDRQYIKTSVASLSQGILGIINSLNDLSNGKYKDLYSQYTRISSEIDTILSPPKEIPFSDLVIPLKSLTRDMSSLAGGKIANLGEIKNRLNLPVPDGFSVTAFAFKQFLDHNNIADKVNQMLAELTIDRIEEINRFCREIGSVITRAEIPSELRKAVETAVEDLKRDTQKHPLMVSVRSSALQEDGDASFAGQYATFLNVPENAIMLKYKEVIASLFRPRAVFYYKTKGFSETEMVMSVGVMSMIDAKAGGVVYTKDPNNPDSDRIIINAAWGLGKSVVDGTVTPHTYIVSRGEMAILEKNLSEQRTMLVCTTGGDIAETAVPEAIRYAPCLSDEQIKTLSGYASTLEQHYGNPQDIEWAVDQNDRIYILQSRPLKTVKAWGLLNRIPRRLEKYNILIDKGLIASKGIGYGHAFVLKNGMDLKNFPEGGVLVGTTMAADFVVVMKKAAAIVTETGSMSGHMASLAREYEVPTIVDATMATSIIENGQEITVDAVNCNIYEGRVEEILKYTARDSDFRDTRVFKILERIFERIAPLNLVSPDAANFSPEYCKTYHDITRFSHEKAMSEMFSIGAEHDMDECHAVPLRAGIPVDAHLIDIGGGLAEDIIKAAPEDIRSIPFSAFLKGMLGMRWPEPRPADVGGFLGMIANTAAIPEWELHETGGRSYAVISGNYMNFSIRLGYHFSSVEAYAGENINDNYIKFHFKGGGATTDRRLRRIRLITEILKRINFTVQVKEDVLAAVLPKFGLSDMVKRLEIMGKLTAYTKQLDMAMYNDAVTDLFIEEFIRDHVNNL